MAERASVFEIANLGLEVTPGTAVAATKRFTGLMVSPDINAEISKWRPSGYRFDTVASLNKEWTEAELSGPVNYTELVYLLCSLMKSVTPVNGTPATAKIWTFDISTTSAEVVQTYTIEVGSAVRAYEFPYALVTSLTLNFGRDTNELSGSMFGKAITDAITLTGGVTEIALVPAMPTQTIIKLADTQAGLAGASAITRGFAVEWSLTDVFGMVWPLNGTTTFAAHVEQRDMDMQVKLTLAADAVGMGILTKMRAATTQFLRIECTGAVIGAGPATYSLIIDCSLKVTDAPPYDEIDGVTTTEWTFGGFHDPVWAKACQIVVVNELAALA